jgi:hypothetical protein
VLFVAEDVFEQEADVTDGSVVPGHNVDSLKIGLPLRPFVLSGKRWGQMSFKLDNVMLSADT